MDKVVRFWRNPYAAGCAVVLVGCVLCLRGKNREQLFDLDTDPGEMVNLAVAAQYRGVLNEHRELLAMWTERTDDRHTAHEAHPNALPPVPGEGY